MRIYNSITPTINYSGSLTFCEGNSVVLNANTGTGLIYKWYKNGIEIMGATSSSYIASQSGNYSLQEANVNNCTAVSASQNVIVTSCNVDLHLRLFYQGYYTGSSTMAPVLLNQGISNDNSVTDTVLVELHSALPPYGIATTKKAILHTDGNANCTFDYFNGNYYLADSYYVAVKHRNGLTTWSANPITFSSTNVNHDFSSSSNKAYGDNMAEMEPNVWAFYTGDLNYDENVDLLDNPILEDDISAYQFGYYTTDINGDGNVDLLDVPVLELNIYAFIYSSQPLWSGTLPAVSTTTVTSILNATAVSGGTIISDGGESIISKGVCWSINPHPTIANYFTNNASGVGNFTSNITGLNPSTTYYVKAYATNSVGTVYGNEISFTTTSLPLTIGQNYRGGKIAYLLQPGDSGYIVGEEHGLIAAANDQSSASQWGCEGTSIGSTSTSMGAGQANTTVILNGCSQPGIAAKLCFDLILNGYADWYLPSKDELGKLILNKDAIGGFTSAYYWSSTEYAGFSSIYAWKQYCSVNGPQIFDPKSSGVNVRAVRSF